MWYVLSDQIYQHTHLDHPCNVWLQGGMFWLSRFCSISKTSSNNYNFHQQIHGSCLNHNRIEIWKQKSNSYCGEETSLIFFCVCNMSYMVIWLQKAQKHRGCMLNNYWCLFYATVFETCTNAMFVFIF